MLRHLIQSLSTGGSILCYHALTEAGLESAGRVNIPRALFEDQVRLLQQVARVVPLSEMVLRHRSGRSTRGLVSITFDDAYASLQCVAPFLAASQVPVSVFVVSNAAAGGSPFWWDRVEDVFPEVSADRWLRFESEVGVPQAFRLGQPLAFGPLRPLRQWVLAEYRGRWPDRLGVALTSMEHDCGRVTKQRSMTWEELTKFTHAAAVEVGIHTMTHPVLPLLSDEEIVWEVATCIAELRAKVDAFVPILAVPFGLYNRRTLEAAKRAGVDECLTLDPSPLSSRSTLGLPRHCVTRLEPKWKLPLRFTFLPGAVRWLCRGSGQERPTLPSATT